MSSLNYNKLIRVTMGNILESDASEDMDENSNKNTDLVERRTDGDGMESSLLDRNTTSNVNLKANNSQSDLLKVLHNTDFQNQNINQNEIIKPNSTKGESPKCFPSPDQLIQLKVPSKVTPITGTTITSTTDSNSNLSQGKNIDGKEIVKQKDCKFVPYEPYAGCTSKMSITKKKVNEQANSSSFPILIGRSPTTISSSTANTSLDSLKNASCISPILFEEQSHSTTLLKERLKIANKDVNELHVENNRLKKLLLDSLSGTAPSVLAEEMKCLSLNIKSSGEMKSNPNSISESFDNLNDEIEVRRSKFLSSCVLVEQLNKDNEQQKLDVTGAVEIFKEIKNSVQLTPELFEKINKWLKTKNPYTNTRYSNSDDFLEDEYNSNQGGSL